MGRFERRRPEAEDDARTTRSTIGAATEPGPPGRISLPVGAGLRKSGDVSPRAGAAPPEFGAATLLARAPAVARDGRLEASRPRSGFALRLVRSLPSKRQAGEAGIKTADGNRTIGDGTGTTGEARVAETGTTGGGRNSGWSSSVGRNGDRTIERSRNRGRPRPGVIDVGKGNHRPPAVVRRRPRATAHLVAGRSGERTGTRIGTETRDRDAPTTATGGEGGGDRGATTTRAVVGALPVPRGDGAPRPTDHPLGAASADHARVIAVDGPAAAGKSTVARMLAERLGAMLFDTGSLYRAVTLAALRHSVPYDDGPALAELAGERHIDVAPPSSPDGRLYDVLLDGEDVTWDVRDQAVEAAVSQVAAHPEVRAALLPTQRRIAAGGAVVMVGRDIGTVVVPDAGVKVFLEASPEVRARRRHRELRERGLSSSFDDVLADLRRRDAIDAGRAASPLAVPEGAEIIRTDGIDAAAVVARIEDVVRAAWERHRPVGDGQPR